MGWHAVEFDENDPIQMGDVEEIANGLCRWEK